MKKLLPEISMILLIAFLNMLSGCHYYMVNTVPLTPGDNSAVNNTLAQPKYFILHHGEQVWHMENIKVDEGKQEITCSVSNLTPDHNFYQKTKSPGVNRYKVSSESPTYEVHIYISEYAELNASNLMIPVGAIQKIEMYDKAVGATTASYVFGTLGIIAGAFVILSIIVLLTKSSCPFVYIHAGNSFHFTGEIYGGAIYSPLERDDYMPLPGLKPVNNSYQLKISNELLERQYTDLAELVIVEHQCNSKVILDKNGGVHTILAPVTAAKAYAGNKADYSKSLASVDSNSFLFNETGLTENDFSSMTMEFKKPLNANAAKLILHAKNSLWFDYAFGKFNELFGTSFNKFSKKQKHSPADRMLKWQLDQGIPLSVYIETEEGWQFVDYFNAIGPLASRDLVMPIDISRVKGENVRIRLQCGFMFWEVDCAAVDFSENTPVKVTHLAPKLAFDQKGHEVSATLIATDKKYLVQPEAGNEVIVSYQVPPSAEGHQMSAFLHSRGYYEYIRDYKGKPDIAYLKSFRQAGAFTRFSKEKYMKFVNDKKMISNALADGKK